MENIEHLRAQFARDCINNLLKDKGVSKKFKPYANSAPSVILKNGLGTTLAFYKTKFESKKDKNDEARAYMHLYKCIQKWLVERKYCAENKDVLDCIINKDNIIFASATEEVLAMLNWMKMFAKAKILDENEEGSKNEK